MAAMAAIMGFQLERFYLFFLIYKSPLYFLPSFKSIGLSVQKKKRKIDFQDVRHVAAAILDFQLEQFKLCFIYKLPLYFQTSFQSIGLQFRRRSPKQIFKMVAIFDFWSG